MTEGLAEEAHHRVRSSEVAEGVAEGVSHSPFGTKDFFTERTVSFGLRMPHGLPGGAAGLRQFVARVEAAGIDRVFVGDHVLFKGGPGFDGLVNAAAVAAVSRRVIVQTAVYLLPLRHPVPVARQVITLAELAPGRLVFGVGLGGEDPAELRACGVDPASRGRRMDEALAVLRPLLAGAEGFYHLPFARFERYCPCGTPEQVAAGLRPYLDAGCRSVNLIPVADGEQAAIDAVAAVREELT